MRDRALRHRLSLTGNVLNNSVLHFGSNTFTNTADISINGGVSHEGTGKIIIPRPAAANSSVATAPRCTRP